MLSPPPDSASPLRAGKHLLNLRSRERTIGQRARRLNALGVICG